jgi:hypothetical protein
MAKSRARAPQHRLDHIPQFVPISDPAWNEDIVAKAILDKEDSIELESGEVVELHPLRRYLQGYTRYDLDEPGLRSVIEKTGCLDLAKAEIWSLRVLAFDHRLRVFQLDAAGSDGQAHLVAFAHGVVGLKTPEDDDAARDATKAIEKLPAKDRKVSQIQALYEAVGNYRMTALDEVGAAVVQLSSDLFEDERKNSD